MKLSLALQSNAAQVAIAAGQLGKAEDSTELFRQTENITGQIQELWAGLLRLRSTIGETPAIDRLQNLVAAIDGKVGELSRASAERIALARRRERLISESEPMADAMNRLLNALPSKLEFEGAVAEPIYNIRVDTLAVAAMLVQVAAINKLEYFNNLRQRYDVTKKRLDRDMAVVASSGKVPEAELAQLRQPIRALVELGDGDAGVFMLREKELRAGHTIESSREFAAIE